MRVPFSVSTCTSALTLARTTGRRPFSTWANTRTVSSLSPSAAAVASRSVQARTVRSWLASRDRGREVTTTMLLRALTPGIHSTAQVHFFPRCADCNNKKNLVFKNAFSVRLFAHTAQTGNRMPVISGNVKCTEPVFVNVYGDQESIPLFRIRFCQPMQHGGPVRQIGLGIDSWAP